MLGELSDIYEKCCTPVQIRTMGTHRKVSRSSSFRLLFYAVNESFCEKFIPQQVNILFGCSSKGSREVISSIYE